jgi:hypothetical protein
MIAINVPQNRIAFKKGMSDVEKYTAIKNFWYHSCICRNYHFPSVILNYSGGLIPIPDEIPISSVYSKDPNYAPF